MTLWEAIITLSRLLKESWALVEDRADKVAGYFYARLFTSHPGLRDLFPLQMEVQRTRLLGAVVHAVQTVDDPEQFDAYLRQLGRDHRKFDVRPEHYRVVGSCLLEALREYAGPAWSLEYEQAWTDAYQAIAARMIDGALADEANPPWWRAEVVGHERRGHDLAVVTVRPERPLPYRAGQYVSLETPYRPRLWRVYSVANAPRSDGLMTFHVRAVGAGWVSSSIVWRLRLGDVVRLGPAIGTMTLDLRSPRDIVCVAGGTGLAPLKAILEELGRTNRTRWAHLFYGARTVDDLYDLAALREMTARFPWLSLIPAVSHEPVRRAYAGFVQSGMISDVLAGYGPWHEHDFYVAGSTPMVRATLRRLGELPVPATRIKYDVFSEM